MTNKPTVAWFTAAPSSTRALTASTYPFPLAKYKGVAPFLCPRNHTSQPYAQPSHQGFSPHSYNALHRPPQPPSHHRALHIHNHPRIPARAHSVNHVSPPLSTKTHHTPSYASPQQHSHAQTTNRQVDTHYQLQRHVQQTHRGLVHSCSQLHQSPHCLHMPVPTGEVQRGRASRLSTQSHTSAVRTTITSRPLLTQLPPLITALLKIPLITAHSTCTPTHASPRAHTAASASHLPCPPKYTIHPRIPAPHNNTHTHKPQTVQGLHNTIPKYMSNKPTVAWFTAAPSSTRALTASTCPS